jgi:Asp-tRNA(Asn)/Glu-tRNA(Gln) amidotransferase A subunit family amidase
MPEPITPLPPQGERDVTGEPAHSAANVASPRTHNGRRSSVDGREESADAGPGQTRRRFMTTLSLLGLGGGLFPGVLWAKYQQARRITAAMVADAEAVAGIELTEEWREKVVDGVNDYAEGYAQVRELDISNAVYPALVFDPALPDERVPAGRRRVRVSDAGRVRRPADLEQVAFWPVTKLAALVRSKQVSSEELTRMYLDRLKRHGPTLQAVITLTEERALAQARQADAEIQAGRYRGPLHGIPWGAKDLLAVKGYPTTWGAEPYRDRSFDYDATVVKRLDAAGAVLVGKLTLGALAQGDQWFGGQTKNPWNLDQGSSGSSAGPAAATAAGLVGFSVGSETQGSIVSPSTRCGATGLRPTFGRVPRTGAMALSWSMDKLGPICRSVEDCAVVLAAIHGPDGGDPTVRDIPFNWDARVKPASLRVGYIRSAFERDHEGKAFDDAALDAVRSLGVDPVPVELPDYPTQPLRAIIRTESAAAFDKLVRTGEVDRIERSARPRALREARFVPAVEYIQANRLRTLIMRALARELDGIDVVVTPSYAPGLLAITNLTGHPVVVVPAGFRDDGTPVSISFLGNLWKDAEAAVLAKAYQDATGWHLKQPPKFAV